MSDYTDEQKKAYVAMAQKQGRPKAAAAAKVTTNTISNWAKAIGVTFSSVPGKPPKKRPAKKKRANGKANGHRKPTGIEAAGAGQLDGVRDQLLAALKSVETMRTALRQVFG
jgi:hypothetical protein